VRFAQLGSFGNCLTLPLQQHRDQDYQRDHVGLRHEHRNRHRDGDRHLDLAGDQCRRRHAYPHRHRDGNEYGDSDLDSDLDDTDDPNRDQYDNQGRYPRTAPGFSWVAEVRSRSSERRLKLHADRQIRSQTKAFFLLDCRDIV